MSVPDHFLRKGRMHGNVVFNFRGHAVNDLDAFAKGYHDAGKRLAEALEVAGGYPDYDGYPVLFLYRHALELYLKAMIIQAVRTLNLVSVEKVNQAKIWKEHSLSKLFNIAKPILDQISKHTKIEEEPFILELRSIISKVDDLDRGSYSFRYPINTSGEAEHESHLMINVLIFAEQLDPILVRLEYLCSELEDAFQYFAETAHEMELSYGDCFDSE